MIMHEIVAEWQEGLSFLGSNDLGNTIQMGSKENKENISPMELMLLGLAGCTGYDVVSILVKKRQQIDNFKIKVRAKRAEDYPMVYTDIEVEYLFSGEDLSKKAIEQAIKLSEEKYCSASVMLGKTAIITSSYKLMDENKVE